MGLMEINWFDNFVSGTLIPSLAAQGVNPATFPIFFLSNVVMYDTVTSNCCILGYHGAFGSTPQTYSPTSFDTSGAFGNVTEDTAVMAHEVGEWMDDPLGTNPVPPWGGIGQVSGCQDNLEVGDPLSDTDFPNVTMPNGYTYHLQELAFYSWFIGAPSLGAGGQFSNNGTFSGDAKLCPPGGTNGNPPVNDNFANRLPLTGASGQSTGTNMNATKESGEPNHAGNAGGASVWWTWTAHATGQVTFDTHGSTFDTLLAVYTGTSVNGLTQVAANDDDPDGGTLTSKVTFTAQAGTVYQIAVDGFGGASGLITLHWPPLAPVASDFNGDVKSDILWHHNTTGQVYVWLMNGLTLQSQGSPATVPDLGWQIQ